MAIRFSGNEKKSAGKRLLDTAREMRDVVAIKQAVEKVSVRKQRKTDEPKAKFQSDQKERITIWIDRDVLTFLRSRGKGWMPYVNDILRSEMESHSGENSDDGRTGLQQQGGEGSQEGGG